MLTNAFQVMYTKPRTGIDDVYNIPRNAAQKFRRNVKAAETDVAESSVKAAALAALELRERRLGQKDPVEFDVDRSSASVHFGRRHHY